MIAVLTAMQAEIENLDRLMNDLQREQAYKDCFRVGKLAGKKIVYTKTGVGKSMAAMMTQKTICLYKPTAIIFSGIAGALNPAYEIGDCVIARDTLQYDLDARCFNFKLGQIPYTDYREFASDLRLIKIAEKTRPEDMVFHHGRILTGDTFFVKRDDRSFRYLRDELHGDAIEMEGAGAALAAHHNGVPFLLFRIISDKADGRAPDDFNRFLKKAGERIAGIIAEIVGRIDKE